MANEHMRDRGNLFENKDKKKPSQPDVQGDCTIGGFAYELRGWKRGDQLTVTLAPPRGDRNTYPPDVFRGSLEGAPPAKPVRPAGKRGGGKDVAPAPAVPAWTGVIVSDDAAYKLTAMEKQGKSGMYWTLSFESVERPAQTDTEWHDPESPDQAE